MHDFTNGNNVHAWSALGKEIDPHKLYKGYILECTSQEMQGA